MSDNDDDRGAPPDLLAGDDDVDNAMFTSAASPPTVDVSLSGGEDEDEDNPFGDPIPRKKTPTNTTNTVESSTDNEKKLFEPPKSTIDIDEEDQDLFGTETTIDSTPTLAITPQTSVTTPEPKPVTPVKEEPPVFSIPASVLTPSTPIKREDPLFQSVASPSTPTYQSQISSSKSSLNQAATTNKPLRKYSKIHDIEISVSDPVKVGEGMSSYMTYRVTTKTTLPMFKKSEFTVNRRFSDFLGLQMKLVSKHLHTGVIIPSPPEKDSLSMAKVKTTKGETVSSDFIDRRRALLERYLNRLAQHKILLEDSNVRDFLESGHDLPKSTNTQALSGDGVLRLFSNITNQVTKLTTKTSEQDQWFEEKHSFVLNLHKHLKNIHDQLNTVYGQRKEAVHSLKAFSTSLNHLATVEEHTLLSSALIELANVEEKLDQANNEQIIKEYSVLTELIKEYISLLEMVHLSFQERIKVHQQWLNAEDTLTKKRENKRKLESTPKGVDKLPQAEMEIQDWEGRVVRSKEEFERISATIKQEMEAFEDIRVSDFKLSVDNYLKSLLEEQEKILNIWENYLPEANKINV